MKRDLTARWAAAMLGLPATEGQGQFTLGQAPPRLRPTVSPAINLGAGGAFSYYGYIKPQSDATRSIFSLQQTLSQLNQDGSLQGQLSASSLWEQQMQQQQRTDVLRLQTGHPATFFNYSHYYPMTPPGGGTGLGGTGGFGGTTGLGGFGPNMGQGVGIGRPSTPTFYGPMLIQGFPR